jgi:hypothetical protein
VAQFITDDAEAREALHRMLSGLAHCNHIDERDIVTLQHDVKSVVVWWYEGSYGPEHSASALVEFLGVTGWATVDESEDTSGHG